MRHLDLFSGIGGFALAARWAGFATIQFVERDAYCQRVLAKNFPGVPIHADICDYSGDALQRRGIERVDLLTGGFPCQPFSVAGRRRGKEDDRYLWGEMFRVIAEVKPSWIVAENTPLLLSMAFDDVCADLESAGYEVGAAILPAVGVNAPHRRDRVWIMAHAGRLRGRNVRIVAPGADASGEWSGNHDAPRRPGEFGGNGAASNADGDSARQQPQAVRTRQLEFGGNGSAFGNADHQWQQQSSGIEREERRRISDAGTLAGNPDDAGREEQWVAESVAAQLATFERADWRTVEPLLCRGAHGVSHRLDRCRGLGNAIVPQVAYPILREIAHLLSNADV